MIRSACLLVAIALPLISLANERQLVVDQSFTEADLDKKWHINFGEWKPVDGTLKTRQLKADNHAAAARYPIITKDATYRVRFRFTNEGRGFHLGFDPAKGELDKKGHLFSVMIKPNSWLIMKQVDKNKPKEDPNKILTRAVTPFEIGQWYSLEVQTRGTEVIAKIEGKKDLTATHPTFSVKKPTVIFRTIGDGVEIDDFKVWKPKI